MVKPKISLYLKSLYQKHGTSASFFQKQFLLAVLFFLSHKAISQAPYSKIYTQDELDMKAEMPLTNVQFSKFINDSVFPILQKEINAHPGKVITKLRMLFTISDKGEISLVEFPGLEASSETHRKLAEAFMKMGVWKPGIKDRKNVCSEFNYEVNCIKWQ